jgi:hypothetical protein
MRVRQSQSLIHIDRAPPMIMSGGILGRQIEATDAAIDKLVYELTGLTEEEIKIVEGNSNT